MAGKPVSARRVIRGGKPWTLTFDADELRAYIATASITQLEGLADAYSHACDTADLCLKCELEAHIRQVQREAIELYLTQRWGKRP